MPGRHWVLKICPDYGSYHPRVASQPILGKTISAEGTIEMKGSMIVTFHAGGVQGVFIEINRRLVPLSSKSMATNHRFLFIHLEDRPVHSGAPLHVVSMNDCTQCNENPDLLSSDLAQLPKQRFANPDPPKCFFHVDVLELHTWSDSAHLGIPRDHTDVYSWFARPRGEVEEVEGETDRLV